MDKKERPILFNGEMVRAILDGRKTQTRRIIKPQPQLYTTMHRYNEWLRWSKGKRMIDAKLEAAKIFLLKECPYGAPGSRLWVRETWNCAYENQEIRYRDADPCTGNCLISFYRADPEDEREGYFADWYYSHWRPSIHMPRWASRILLEIMGVRIERVQDIDSHDALKEGVEILPSGVFRDYLDRKTNDGLPHARQSFISLFDSIYAERGFGWKINPWVWMIEFKPI